MPLQPEMTQKGLYRFMTGHYADYASADSSKKAAINAGVKDAFIVVYKSGERTALHPVTTAKKENTVDQNRASSSVNTIQVKDVSTSSEIIYKVQIGAFRQPLSEKSINHFQKISSNSISNETTSSGLQVYYSGSFSDLNSALFAKNLIVANGVKDAFIVAFANGKKFSVNSLKTLSKK
jgi:hypothetical protein